MKPMFIFSLVMMMISQSSISLAKNVLGKELKKCGSSPRTGFYRDGYCHTGPDDEGTHVVCASMTRTFLEFTKGRGNDLITSKPEWGFPGLKPGDRWCLCALRWIEAKKYGVAPKPVLESTHEKFLEYGTLSDLSIK